MSRNLEEQLAYGQKYTHNKSLYDEENRHGSKYSIGVIYTTGIINIPSDFDAPGTWHPTLGPKVNSEFPLRGQNCVYSMFEHPRYGCIDCVRAIKDIKAGEELFTDYGYQIADFPSDHLWYHAAKEQYLAELERKGGVPKQQQPERHSNAFDTYILDIIP